MEAFLYTASLSQNMSVGPVIGMPNIRSLYRSGVTNSTAFLSAVNSDLNVEFSTEFYRLLCHMTGARLIKNKTPVCDLLETLSAVCFASTKHCVVTTLPHCSDMSTDIGSCASI